MREQMLGMRMTVSCLQAWFQSALWQPVAMFWKQKYDETKLRMRVKHGSQNAMQPHMLQTAQSFVVETSYACLLRRPASSSENTATLQDYLYLTATFTPEIRVADRNDCNAILAVLQSCVGPDEKMTEAFPKIYRLVETDSAGANMKAERKLQQLGLWRRSNLFSFYCCAHRVHQAATRVLDMEVWKPITSGYTHAALVLQNGGMPAALTILHDILEQKFVYERTRPDIDRAALVHKQRALEAFGGGSQHAKAWFLLCMAFFNADWRLQDRVRHHCSGCCENEHQAKEKAEHLLGRLLVLLRPKPLSKSNWKTWSNCLVGGGALNAVHGLYTQLMSVLVGTGVLEEDLPVFAAPPAFQHQRANVVPAGASNSGGDGALGGVGGVSEHPHDGPEEANVGLHEQRPREGNLAANMAAQVGAEQGLEVPAADDEQVQDPVAAMREQEKVRKAKVRSFLRTPQLWDKTYILMMGLQAERNLMDSILFTSSAVWDLQEMRTRLRTGQRSYPLSTMQLSNVRCPFTAFMTASAALLQGNELWDHLAASHELANLIVTTVCRSVATVHELCVQPSRRFPLRLLELLDTQGSAERISATPRCLLDDFSKRHLSEYASPETLDGVESRAILQSIMQQIDTHTFTTERLHSRNLRQCKSRLQTQQVDVSWLAAQHCSCAGPPWCLQLPAPDAAVRSSALGKVSQRPRQCPEGRPAEKEQRPPTWW